MSTFARRGRSLKRAAGISLRTLAAPARRWRDLLITTRTEELFRAEGFEASAEELIERARKVYRSGFEADTAPKNPETPAGDPVEWAASFGDQVLWDGIRVVAILRPRPDGTMDRLAVPAGPLAS